MRLTRSSPVKPPSPALFGRGVRGPDRAGGGRSRGLEPPAPGSGGAHKSREVARFGPDDQEPVRIAAQAGTGRLFVLGGGGDVTVVDPKSGAMRRVLEGKDYIDRPADQTAEHPAPGRRQGGQCADHLAVHPLPGDRIRPPGRLYVTANVQVPGKIFINRVCLYRTSPVGTDGGVPRPELWTRFDHPYGVGGFNHGAGRIAQGPDGMIYLGSGSRTDHGEAGDEPNISRLGEGPHPDVPGGPGFPGGEFTACILRFDPAKGQQAPEVYSRGNRNPFGFDWDDKGRLIDAEHGPMADHPEELNQIRAGQALRLPVRLRRRRGARLRRRPQGPRGLRVRARRSRTSARRASSASIPCSACPPTPRPAG